MLAISIKNFVTFFGSLNHHQAKYQNTVPSSCDTRCNACRRNLIGTGLTSAASPRVHISSACKVGQKLGVSLPLLTCSPSAWPSRLLNRRGRKSRRDLWITLYMLCYWLNKFLYYCETQRDGSFCNESYLCYRGCLFYHFTNHGSVSQRKPVSTDTSCHSCNGKGNSERGAVCNIVWSLFM
jgi:hypothetical protein